MHFKRFFQKSLHNIKCLLYFSGKFGGIHLLLSHFLRKTKKNRFLSINKMHFVAKLGANNVNIFICHISIDFFLFFSSMYFSNSPQTIPKIRYVHIIMTGMEHGFLSQNKLYFILKTKRASQIGFHICEN